MKLGVPRPVTCGAQGHPTSKINKSGGTHRIPSNGSRESFGAATRIRATCDVIESYEVASVQSVQPGVEEAERGKASRKLPVIK
jgi:hypothetical protein